MSLLLIAWGCEQEPEDPYERFIYQFEQKMDVLLEHMANADEVMDGEATFVGGNNIVSTDLDYYRYKHIGPAAIAVMEHFTQPELSFYLTISHAEAIDPKWVNRLKETYRRANDPLQREIERFRKRMPRRADAPRQSTELGRSVTNAFGRGGIYGGSHRAKIGQYEYDENGALWFYTQGGKIQLDKLLALNIDDWLRTLGQ